MAGRQTRAPTQPRLHPRNPKGTDPRLAKKAAPSVEAAAVAVAAREQQRRRTKRDRLPYTRGGKGPSVDAVKAVNRSNSPYRRCEAPAAKGSYDVDPR